MSLQFDLNAFNMHKVNRAMDSIAGNLVFFNDVKVANDLAVLRHHLKSFQRVGYVPFKVVEIRLAQRCNADDKHFSCMRVHKYATSIIVAFLQLDKALETAVECCTITVEERNEILKEAEELLQ